ncbi:hypothetical protein E2C01_018071 [Portunus trituberculatus]|uniref:Uncharacterized protein n=1 Tax=Portunus trituberculatus TaxID=210409 RepID=A0A5B7DVH4_PORTR|nr:hypothetical protein [Portunus trituberculatus]
MRRCEGTWQFVFRSTGKNGRSRSSSGGIGGRSGQLQVTGQPTCRLVLVFSPPPCYLRPDPPLSLLIPRPLRPTIPNPRLQIQHSSGG